MFTSFDNPPEYGNPDYYIIPMDGLVEDFLAKWNAELTEHITTMPAQYHQSMPDVSKILSESLAVMKQINDVELEVSMFAYRDVQATVMYNLQLAGAILPLNTIINIANRLCSIAEEFGMRLHYHLRSLNFYDNGFFPYYFVGWMGKDMLVGLDATHGGGRGVPESLQLRTRDYG